MKILFFALFINFQHIALVNDINNPNTHFKEKIDVNTVFYMDQESELLFIDFANIPTTVSEVKVLLEEQEVMVEDVKELDQNMIYEIDLTLLNEGKYLVEVIIENETNIQTHLIIE